MKNITEKQRKVLTALEQCPEGANLEEIYSKVSFSYYFNHKKHLGDIMSRLVKRGLVVRVKKGVYKISKENKKSKNQISLF